MQLIRKPKIAIISIRNTYSFGGVFATLKVVHDFCNQYFEPTVFFLSFDPKNSAHVRPFKFSSSTQSSIYHGMNCVEIGARWAFWEPGHYEFTAASWQEALRGFNYFFVVSATPIAGHPLALLNKKFIVWLSTSYEEDRQERVKKLTGSQWLLNKLANHSMEIIEKLVLTKASYVLALSKYSLNQFKKRVPAVITKTAICGYPVETTNTPIISKHEPLSLLAVGRFTDPRKNIEMLLRVFSQISKKIANITLYVVGQPPEPEILYDFTGQPGFENIVFTGQVSKHDLILFYQKAHLMLITSYQEGFGISGLEGLLYGMPIIATDCGGVKDYVINNETGFIVPINDDKAMVEKALELLTNPTLRNKFALTGQQLVHTLFSQQKIYSTFKHALNTTYPELTALLSQQPDSISLSTGASQIQQSTAS